MDNGLTGVSDCRGLAPSTRRRATGSSDLAFGGKVIAATTGERTHAAAVLKYAISIGSKPCAI